MEREIEEIKVRYAKRLENCASENYNPLLPSVFMSHQELERMAITRIFSKLGASLYPLNVLEVGCGNGANIAKLIKYGFDPNKIVGIDILGERIEDAKRNLPCGVSLILGDASQLNCINKFDLIYVSTVFSSILDSDTKSRLAKNIWNMLRPGGGIYWYDFIYNNPKNPDVRGLARSEVRALFPESKPIFWSVTLAPPISRFVVKLHPCFYTLFNFFPFLRTHILGWIAK